MTYGEGLVQSNAWNTTVQVSVLAHSSELKVVIIWSSRTSHTFIFMHRRSSLRHNVATKHCCNPAYVINVLQLTSGFAGRMLVQIKMQPTKTLHGRNNT